MATFSGRIFPLLWRRSVALRDTGQADGPQTTAGRPGGRKAGQGQAGAGQAGGRRAVGRPARLSVDLVVSTGIRIADAEGLEAASMARVAAELSVGTMTLYTYAPSRPELIELMVDEVLGSRNWGPDGASDPAAWRDLVRHFAAQTFAMYRAHPWLARVSQLRPPIGPGMLAESEFVLATVSLLGLPLPLVNTAAATITTWVTSAARAEAEAILLERDSGVDADAWWAMRGELWERWFVEADHPVMSALWRAGGIRASATQQADESFELGLGLLLDGLERQAR